MHHGSGTPYQDNGYWVYPSREEADYPADFCLAVACAASFWALRNGFKMNLPASLQAACTGDKAAQLEHDPRIERKMRFALKASKAGLDPRKFQQDLPYRLSIAEFKMLRPKKRSPHRRLRSRDPADKVRLDT